MPTPNNAFGKQLGESKNKVRCGPLLTTARKKTVSSLVSQLHSRKLNGSLLNNFLTGKKTRSFPHFKTKKSLKLHLAITFLQK